MRRLTIVLGLVAALVGLGAAPALAESPLSLSGPVTDRAGVLQSGGQQQIQQAFTTLRQNTGTQAYVVYVDGFGGLSADQWARQTAQRSGLSGKYVLLAVAVQERHYAFGNGTSLSDSAVQNVVSNDVVPQLRATDWVGAAVALAQGLESNGGGSGSGHSGAIAAGVVILLFVLAGGGYLFFRSRRRRREQRDADEAAPQQPDPFPGTPTPELNARASTALLDLDEQVRTAQVSLDYARSYYGEEAVPGYGDALAGARDELAQAFAIRQQLDDDIPEDEPTTRRMLADLLRLTGDADTRLKSATGAVDRLRQREQNVPQAVAQLSERIGALQQRLPQEEQRLGDLQRRYAGSAVAAVADNVREAQVRLTAAEDAIAQAQEQQQAGHTGRSVGLLVPAEEAVRQSTTLLDGIGRLATDLAAVEQRIAALRGDIDTDLAEARSMSGDGDRGALRSCIARAEAATAAADAALRPSGGDLPDPLAALRRLEEADAALREALQSARDARTQARKAAAALDQTLLTARSAVAAAGDFISTRRGAVGPEARTRLAEAQRHLDAATAQAQADPVAALSEAQRADQLAQYALQVAQSDVDQWSQQTGYGYGGGYGGTWGGGGYGGYGGWGGRRGGIGRDLGMGLGGLVLGGLLFGHHDRGWGGGWGADGGADYDGGAGWGGGDFGGGDFGGGDFGGGDFGGGDFGGGDFGGGDFGGGGGSF